MPTQTSSRSYLLLLGIGLIWGGQFLFNARAVEDFPPFTVAAVRVLLGALTLSVVACFIKEDPGLPHKRSLSATALLGLIALFDAVLPLFLIIWGQQHVASSITAVMIGGVPVITLLLSLLMGKRNNFTVYSGLSVLAGFIGIFILVNPSSGSSEHSLIYETAIFLGAVSFAISLNLMEKIPLGAPIRSTRDMLWMATVPLAITAIVLDKPWGLHWSLDGGLLSLILLGTLGSGAVYLMYVLLVQRSGSVFTSLSNFIVPMVGVALGVTVRGESFGARQGWALALIVIALALNEARSFIRRNRPGSPSVSSHKI